ncbi:hypothetical protein [uncultured Jannaschia sp.]|uniref:hypothetical protein n=1 Tax=uncultured Jannaschia sp. TaxID=293347 RepID=UPI00262F8054|nr:hypothetical protein [uncultured Jannaschia sp.]
MTTPYDDSAAYRAKILIPTIHDTLDGSGLLTLALRLMPAAPGDPGVTAALVELGERIFLHEEDVPRRALIAQARSDVRLSGWMLTDILPAIALRLEDGWNHDRLSFVDVTIAAARIQDGVRRLGRIALPPAEMPAVAMIVPVWEQHALAATFAAEEMRRLGAPVRLVAGTAVRDIPALLERFPAAALMISSSSGRAAARVPELIRDLRRHVRRALPVVVGGAALITDPDLGVRAGGDLGTNSAADALAFCDLAPCLSPALS